MFRKFTTIIILALIAVWFYYAYQFTNFFCPNTIPKQTWISKDAVQDKLETVGKIQVVEATYSISQKASSEISSYISWDDEFSLLLRQAEQWLQKDDIYVDATGTVIAGYDFLSGVWSVEVSGDVVVIDTEPTILVSKVDSVNVVQRDIGIVPMIFWQDLWLEEYARSQAQSEIIKKALSDGILDQVNKSWSEVLLKLFAPMWVDQVVIR